MTRVRIAVAAALLVILQIIGFHGVRHDDAYITYRYGQNLASGRGLVFNPGERSMGFTSPGHALLSSAAYVLVGKERLPDVMAGLGCLGWTAQALAVLLLLRLALPLAGALFVALCVALGAAWSQRFVSLETNLVSAAVLWSLVAALHARWLAAGALAAVAGLLRPDAWLIILPLGVLCVRERRLAAWKPVAVGAAITVPWLVFAALYYGTVLPQTAAAKIQTAGLAEYREAVLQYTAANVVLPEPVLHMPRIVVIDYTPFCVQACTVLVWLAALGGAIVLIHRHTRLWLLPAWLVLHLGAYLLLRAQVGIEWHLYPVLLVTAIFALSLVAWTASRLPQSLPGHALRLALFVPLLVFYTHRTVHSARIHDRAFWYGARDKVYRKISRFLRKYSRSGDTVRVGEAGTIAYWSELPVVDVTGLITRDRTARHPPRWQVSVTAYPLAPCPVPPIFGAASQPTLPGELRPRGRRRFAATVCDLTIRADQRPGRTP